MSAEIPQLDVAMAIKSFLSTICSPSQSYLSMLNMDGTNEKLEAAMRAELRDRNIVSSYLERTVHLAASLSELAFKDCTLEEKKVAAMYNWFTLYTDDKCNQNPAPFIAFQQRFLQGLPQLDPVLDAFAALLHDVENHYSTSAVNTVISATFDFVNATAIESEMVTSPTPHHSTRFPGFLRDRTGLGISCAVMIFPNSRSLDFVSCFRALPDMNFWIAAVNDILSFYKEDLAGETANYINNRAKAEGKDALQVLLALGDEALGASEKVSQILGNAVPDGTAVAAWKSFEAGFVAWHLQQDRYKLKSLGL